MEGDGWREGEGGTLRSELLHTLDVKRDWYCNAERPRTLRNIGILLPHKQRQHRTLNVKRDWYLVAEQPAPAPHLAHPEGCAALR